MNIEQCISVHICMCSVYVYWHVIWLCPSCFICTMYFVKATYFMTAIFVSIRYGSVVIQPCNDKPITWKKNGKSLTHSVSNNTPQLCNQTIISRTIKVTIKLLHAVQTIQTCLQKRIRIAAMKCDFTACVDWLCNY